MIPHPAGFPVCFQVDEGLDRSLGLGHMRHVYFDEGDRFQKVLLQFLLYKLSLYSPHSFFVTLTHIPGAKFPIISP